MTNPTPPIAADGLPGGTGDPDAEGWLVCFRPEGPGPGVAVLRRFTDPRGAAAVAERVPLPTAGGPIGSADALAVVFVRPKQVDPGLDAWLAAPTPDDGPVVVAANGENRVSWRLGRAVIEAAPSLRPTFLAAVADFAFFEAELRRIEQAVAAYEGCAGDDVRLAYEIRRLDRPHWDRLRRTMEGLTLLRLELARIQPHLLRPPLGLPPASRRLAARLLAKTGVEGRLQAIDGRLQACEDLYEGAVDRIIDYGWWRSGHLLEVAIVVLLVVEAALMGAELLFHR